MWNHITSSNVFYLRKRTVRTVAKVALLALVFSVPKFLEVESWGDDVQVTNLRRHPSYSVFAMWTISIFTGKQGAKNCACFTK